MKKGVLSSLGRKLYRLSAEGIRGAHRADLAVNHFVNSLARRAVNYGEAIGHIDPAQALKLRAGIENVAMKDSQIFRSPKSNQYFIMTHNPYQIPSDIRIKRRAENAKEILGMTPTKRVRIARTVTENAKPFSTRRFNNDALLQNALMRNNNVGDAYKAQRDNAKKWLYGAVGLGSIGTGIYNHAFDAGKKSVDSKNDSFSEPIASMETAPIIRAITKPTSTPRATPMIAPNPQLTPMIAPTPRPLKAYSSWSPKAIGKRMSKSMISKKTTPVSDKYLD
jgi:hypothetical protein